MAMQIIDYCSGQLEVDEELLGKSGFLFPVVQNHPRRTV